MIWVSRWGFLWVVGLGGKPRGGCSCLEVLPPAISICTPQAFIYLQGKGWETAGGSWSAVVSPGEDGQVPKGGWLSPFMFKGLWRGGGPLVTLQR